MEISKKAFTLIGWALPSSVCLASVWGQGTAQEAVLLNGAGVQPQPITFDNTLNTDAYNIYAAHRSHSSHSSHRSHSSHYSGSGGSYSSPSYSSTPSSTTSSGSGQSSAPAVGSSPSSTPNSTSKPNENANKKATPSATQLAEMVRRVQVALYSKGFDPGPLSGELNEKTRQALMQFQKQQGLPDTGQMDTDTLNALGVRMP